MMFAEQGSEVLFTGYQPITASNIYDSFFHVLSVKIILKKLRLTPTESTLGMG